MNSKLIESSQQEIKIHWKSILLEGILFLILGFIAMSVPAVFSIAFELLIGWLFLLGGAVQLYRAIQSDRAPGFWLFVLSALFAMIFGVLMIFNPLQGLVGLTAIIACYFLAEGIVKLFYAFQISAFANWIWVFISGLCSILIAAMVFSGFPLSSAWFIGLLMGVYLVINGISLILIAWKAHQ